VSVRGSAGRLGDLALRRGSRGPRTADAPAAPAALLELARRGPAPLAAGGADRTGPLSVAVVIPSFRRGSGGHATIVNLMRELRELGHTVTLWLEDWEGRHAREASAVTEASFEAFFAAEGLRLHTDFTRWNSADVVVATGWQTVPRALLLGGVRARAYLVQDHEPDFYGASAEALWAAQTYRHGLHCIAASPWLAELLRERYGASVTAFDLAVDHEVYRPASGPRNEAQVLFYARAVTPRRAVPLGLVALSELARRRPDVEIVLYGEERPLAVDFEHRHMGLLEGRALAELYSQASVGMVLSLTNPSLVGLEMMACGLPCVELASEPMLASFPGGGPLELAAPDPLSLAGALERLLSDPRLRSERSREGLALLSSRTWERAAAQLQEGLEEALRCTRTGAG